MLCLFARFRYLGFCIALHALALNAQAAAPGVCTSENAPGTPDGSECKCQAAGPGVSCKIAPDVYNGVVICQDKTGQGEACFWVPGDGCDCVEVNKLRREGGITGSKSLD